VVLLLLSLSPAIYESTYPYRKVSKPPKHNACVVVPLKYLRIHFTTSQCSLPRLFIYLLTTPTACAISGLVQTIAYIKLPTGDEYGTLDMYSISSCVLGHISLINLKWLAKGVLTGFAFCILNLSNTFSVYSP
jgi:hypothetical protein